MDLDHRPNQQLVDYYSALELVLCDATRARFGEYRTHFGPAQSEPPSDYCWLSTSVDPGNHLAGADFISTAFRALEDKLATDLDHEPPRRILDVGCGAGGTMRTWLERWPECTVTGININEHQLASATELLAPYGERAQLIRGNFFDTPLPAKHFDFIYFVESAFHMPDKEAVLRAVMHSLAPGGRVRFVDVFLSERAAEMAKRKKSVGGTREGDSIFSYETRDLWLETARGQGLRHDYWNEFGKQVARFLHIGLSWEEMQERYVRPRLGRHARRAEFTQSLHNLYTGYKRLQRLLRAGALEYATLGFRR